MPRAQIASFADGSMRTSSVPMCFCANLVSSLTARGARCDRQPQATGRAPTDVLEAHVVHALVQDDRVLASDDVGQRRARLAAALRLVLLRPRLARVLDAPRHCELDDESAGGQWRESKMRRGATRPPQRCAFVERPQQQHSSAWPEPQRERRASPDAGSGAATILASRTEAQRSHSYSQSVCCERRKSCA